MLDLEEAVVDPDRDGSLRQTAFPIQLPVLKTDRPMSIQVARLARGEQDTIKNRGLVQGAFVLDLGRQEDDGSHLNAPRARHQSLPMVVLDKAPLSGNDLLRGVRPRELGIGHFSGSSEVCLSQILPGLPWLDALFPDPQGRVRVHGLVTVKNRPTIADDHGWSTKGRERRKKYLKVIPLVL